MDREVPREAALAAFRKGSAPVTELAGGASSREELVRQFVAAVERADTAALRVLGLTRTEFAYLYYPTAPQSRPPYDLAPDLFWFLIVGQGNKGASHLLEQFGGAPLGYLRHECAPTPSVEGGNRIWGPCSIWRRLAGGDSVSQRLFGLIIERGGRFKFVSYANQLD